MYKIAVIGRGLMGSAAGRHLSMISDSVAIIGPNEPKDTANHDGIFLVSDHTRLIHFL